MEYIILDDVFTISTTDIKVYKSKKDSKKSEKSLEVSEKPLPILLELLDTLDSNNFTAYGTWFDLLMACKNVGISYESFDTFSKKCNGYNESNNRELWDNYSVDNNKNLFGIPKLIEFAKNSDEGKTDSILKKYNYYNENYIIERIIEKNAHSDIACLYLSNNDGVLFYRVSKKTFLVYNKTTCLWEYLENDEVVLPSRINKCISPIIEKHLTVVKNKLKYLELNFKSLI